MSQGAAATQTQERRNTNVIATVILSGDRGQWKGSVDGLWTFLQSYRTHEMTGAGGTTGGGGEGADVTKTNKTTKAARKNPARVAAGRKAAANRKTNQPQMAGKTKAAGAGA